MSHAGWAVGPYAGRVQPLDALGAPSPRRRALQVTPDALRRIRGGHPWVYDRSITHVGDGGELGVVFDRRRRFAAIGFYDPRSPIRLRVLHHGAPRAIDDEFWRERLQVAAGRRASLVASGDTTGYRCVNGESDGIGGLIIDRYDTVGVAKVYSEAVFPHLRAIVTAALDAFALDTVVLRLARRVEAPAGLHDGITLIGTAPTEPVVFTENGLRFEADVVHGQKTGHFLDQRDNRARVRALAHGRRVLDMFAATGGFGVYAAAGGARRVTSVDASEPTLAVAARNFARLEHSTATETLVGDAFEVFARLARQGRSFDLVVIDPPSFASREEAVPRALRSYERLTTAALRVLARGGTLVQASCSSRIDDDQLVGAVERAAEAAGRSLSIDAVTGHAIDHPATFPEARYLNAVFATADTTR